MNVKQFLTENYTAFHTVDKVCKTLVEAGFSQLNLGERWNLKTGDKRFVTQNDSSVVAFVVGKNGAFNVCESHTDSPCFKVKGTKVVCNGNVRRLNTEKYGGGLLYSFFDRPLKIAGRLLVETENGVESQLVASDYNVVIPSLAIHHNPTANDGVAFNLQNDTLPLFSQGKTDLYETLTDKKVLDADLFVVSATEPFVAGVDGEFLCSPRIDNLTSVFASVSALIRSNPQNVAVVACLDNEEIGSGTRQGSPDFLQSVLCAIENGLNFSDEQKTFARQNGMVVSVDNGHAIHPAHPEKSDPQQNVVMNGGVVIKHHPNYATDGLSSALFKKVMSYKQIPVQDYYNRSDVRCGSTLGLATSALLQMKTCDIGLAQLAMHSACETVGTKDVETMQNALELFLSVQFCSESNGISIKYPAGGDKQ